MIYQNSSFSRTRENEAKMGAYYTDPSHCRDIGKMFLWPDDEVSVLEPCIGDARAVMEVTQAPTNENIKIFGVELNDTVADATAKNPHIEALLKADFTNGIMIRKNCFSFCFANPPYLSSKSDMEGSSERLERQFLERIVNYLKIGGILVWVVPYSQFSELQHTRMWMRNFETLCMYRFRDSEYQKYHQVVVVGRKVAKHEVLSMQVSEHMGKYHLDSLSVLPSDLTPTIQVLPSKAADVDLFTTRVFDHEAAYQYLESNGFGTEICAALDRRISEKVFAESELLQPPIPLKKDSLYLLATSGVGQGLTGSEENGDLHLQRGVAEVVEESHYDSYDETEDTDGGRIVVTTHTAIVMTIVQNNGTITTLS